MNRTKLLKLTVASIAVIATAHASARAGAGGGRSGRDDELNAALDRDLGWDELPGQITGGDPTLRRWWVKDRAIILRIMRVPAGEKLPNPEECWGRYDELPGEYFEGWSDRATRRWWTGDHEYVWLRIIVVSPQGEGKADTSPPLVEFPHVNPGVVDPLPPYTNKTPWLDPIYPRDLNGVLPE